MIEGDRMANDDRAPQSDETVPQTRDEWMEELRRNGSLGGLTAQVQRRFDSCQTLKAVDAAIPKARRLMHEWFDAFNDTMKRLKMSEDELDTFRGWFYRSVIGTLADDARERIGKP